MTTFFFNTAKSTNFEVSISEMLMKCQSRSFNQVSTTSLWIIDFLLGRSYIQANEALALINKL